MTITESSNKDTEAAIDNIVADTAVVKAETSGAEADEEAEDFAISKRGDDNNKHVTATTRHADDYPNNVTTKDQLALLPDCYLSDNKYRPLQLKISNEEIYT